MQNINKVIITGRHPLYDHIITTRLGSIRFDVNIRDNIVWESMRYNGVTKSYHNKVVNNQTFKNYIIESVKQHLTQQIK